MFSTVYIDIPWVLYRGLHILYRVGFTYIPWGTRYIPWTTRHVPHGIFLNIKKVFPTVYPHGISKKVFPTVYPHGISKKCSPRYILPIYPRYIGDPPRSLRCSPRYIWSAQNQPLAEKPYIPWVKIIYRGWKLYTVGVLIGCIHRGYHIPWVTYTVGDIPWGTGNIPWVYTVGNMLPDYIP